MKPTFHPGYVLATLAIFIIEVLIALYVRDAFIRPFGGDILAVILVYCGLRAITTIKVYPATLLALSIAFLVEIAQALNLITHIGLADNDLARIVLGTSFAWGDIAAYVAGAVIILLVEQLRSARSKDTLLT